MLLNQLNCMIFNVFFISAVCLPGGGLRIMGHPTISMKKYKFYQPLFLDLMVELQYFWKHFTYAFNSFARVLSPDQQKNVSSPGIIWQFAQLIKQFSLQLSTHPYSVSTRAHVSPSFSSCPWTSALSPSISNLPHATYTSSVPINTSERSHRPALWPCPRLSGRTGPEAVGCGITLSQVSVGHLGDRWAPVSSSDPPSFNPRWDGVREHWLWCYMWQGWIKDELTVAREDKRHQGYGWAAAG